MAVTKVVMPKLSDRWRRAVLIKWLKKEGDKISGGDILAEVETDKADVEMEAFGSASCARSSWPPDGDTAGRGADRRHRRARRGHRRARGPGPGAGAARGGRAARRRQRGAPAAAPPRPAPRRPRRRRGRRRRSGRSPRPVADPPPRPPAAAGGRRRRPAARSPLPRSPEGGRPALDGRHRPRRGRIAPRRRHRAAPCRPAGRRRITGREASAAGARPLGAAAPAAGRPSSRTSAHADAQDHRQRCPESKAPVPHFYLTAEVAMDRAWRCARS